MVLDPTLLKQLQRRTKEGKLSERTRGAAQAILDVPKPPTFGEELKETWEQRKWLPEKIRKPIGKVTEFLKPESKEEALKMGLVPVGNSDIYVDPWAVTAGLQNVPKGIMDRIGKEFLRNAKGRTIFQNTVKTIQRGVRSISQKVLKKPTQLQSAVRGLISKRYGEIKTGILDSELFRNVIKQNLTKEEQRAMPFIIEGTYKGRVRPEAKQMATKIKDYYDEGYKYLAKNFDDLGFVENYVNRIWDIPKNKQAAVVGRFTKTNPFTKKRAIPTLKEGIKMGLKPKTTNITELIEVYDTYKFKTVANKRFLDSVNKMVNPDTGKMIVQRADRAPANFVLIDQPLLSKGVAREINGKWTRVAKIPAKVDPEIAKEIKVIMDKPFSSTGVRALQTVNAFAKKTALSLSLFHHWALTESAISAGVGRKAFKMWNPAKIYGALKKGRYDIYTKSAIAKDGLQHGLQLGAISDVQRGTVSNVLKNIELKTKNIPVVKKITKGIRGFNDLWDKSLWDYYHNGLKLYTYEKWTQDALKKYTTKSPTAIKEQVAQLVNDTFGGQVWEKLLVTPKAQQVAHWALLSPDWTLSTLRQAAAPFAKEARGVLGRKFWLRAAFYMWGGSNIINGIMSQKHLGEWRWMWENDPKHKTYIFMGFNEDGSKKYLRFGKQYREIFEWFDDPIKKFGGKLAPTVREAYKQVSGVSPTGWEAEWKGKSFWDIGALGERAKSILEMGLPYSAKTIARSKSILGVAFPISKGLSWYEARELMTDAIQRKDRDMVTEIWRASLENNLNAKDIFNQAKGEVKAQARWEYKDVEKLIRDLRKMGKEEGLKKLQELKASGELTPEVEKQMKTILKGEAEVRQQRAQTGI